MRRFILFILTIMSVLGSNRDAVAQLPEFGSANVEITSVDELISWESSAAPAVIGPGGRTLVSFDARMEGDWKLYALESSLPPLEEVGNRPFGVTISWTSLPDGVTAEETLYQLEPEEGLDPVFETTLKYFHERARFVASLNAAEDASRGLDSLVADLRFQICSDELKLCMRPTTVSLAVNLRIDDACLDPACSASEEDVEGLISVVSDWGTEGRPAAVLVSPTIDFEQYRSGGLFSFLLLAIGAGLASLLTPCVFPMIPLTVSYFTKHAHDRAEATRMATLFGASIIITFTSLGIIAALVVGAAGAQQIASNPWVNLFIAFVLIGFALSLLGLYELRLPNKLVNFFDRQGKERSGWVGVVFMGLTLTLVSFSCTAPFVGGLLAAASGGTWMYPLVGMLAYSTTFALPFIFFALFPNALSRLPKSGSWMNTTKVVLGFIELAAAVKFLSNSDLIWQWELISRPLGIAFVVVIFFLTGTYLLGKLRLHHEPPLENLGVGRMLAATGFFVLALYMIPGLLGAPLNRLDAYLPPRNVTDISVVSLLSGLDSDSAVSSESAWFIDDIEGAFATASKSDKPVFVDFSGYTCTNCREMEANVFIRGPIVERFESDFILLRLYTDGLEKGDEFSRYQLDLTGTVALPTFAIVTPDGLRLISRASGMMDIEEFGSFLDAGSSSLSNEIISVP